LAARRAALVRSLMIFRSRSASAAHRCKVKLSASAPSSATMKDYLRGFKFGGLTNSPSNGRSGLLAGVRWCLIRSLRRRGQAAWAECAGRASWPSLDLLPIRTWPAVGQVVPLAVRLFAQSAPTSAVRGQPEMGDTPPNRCNDPHRT
jgi:hypothetical protein